MDLFTCLTCVILVKASIPNQLHLPEAITQPAIAAAPTKLAKKTSSQKAPMVTVKLLPYEILAGTATSYADVSLTVTNPANRPQTVTINQIEIMTATNRKVLLRSTPADLKQPAQLVLQPGEEKVVHYRLQTPNQIYQAGQEVIAEVRYRSEQAAEQTARSGSEAVAFMIP